MLGAGGSLSIEPVEQVGKIVSVIKIKADLFHVVHQRRPVRDRINPAHTSRPGNFSIVYRIIQLSL